MGDIPDMLRNLAVGPRRLLFAIFGTTLALGATDIRWMSDEKLTPGWDIQYRNKLGEVIAIEVKGTSRISLWKR